MSDKELEEYTSFVERVMKHQCKLDLVFFGIYVSIAIILAIALAVLSVPGS